MTYRPWEVALGAVVMITAIVFVAFALRTTGTALGATGSYTLNATFRSAEGVRPGAELRLAGVKIGNVTGMSLDPQSFRAQIEMSVDSTLELPLDSTIQVATEGLLGGTYLEILPGGDMDVLQPGETFQDTQSSVSLITLLLRAFTGSDDEATE